MKKFLVLLLVLFSGCATVEVVKYNNNNYPPKGLNDQIDIYDAAAPAREYVEVAKLKYNGATSSINEQKALDALKAKAQELGADGLILRGVSESSETVQTITLGSSEHNPLPRPKSNMSA